MGTQQPGGHRAGWAPTAQLGLLADTHSVTGFPSCMEVVMEDSLPFPRGVAAGRKPQRSARLLAFQARPGTEVSHSAQGLQPPLGDRGAEAGPAAHRPHRVELRLRHPAPRSRAPQNETNKTLPVANGRRPEPTAHREAPSRPARPFPGGHRVPPAPPAASPRPRDGRSSALRYAFLAARRSLTASPGPLRLRPPPARTKAPTAAAARRRRKARR